MASQPLPAAEPSVSHAPEPSSPSPPRKFDNLYLDPPPQEAPKDLDTTAKEAPIQQSIIPRAGTAIERPRSVFTKPELPPISYAKRSWVLHQHEDLQTRIDQVQSAITSQEEQRAAILANELLFFEEVNKAEKSLRTKMLREDKRQHAAGVCWDYRSAVVHCLTAGKNCAQEIAGWKHCENERN